MNQQFQVQGMSCGHCVKTVQQAVQALDPEARVAVDLTTGRVDIDSNRPRPALTAAIEDAGYQVQ